MSEELLKLENIYKNFGNVKVLKNVNITINKGEVVALIGDNGAGKSTLIKVLSGVHPASNGEIKVDGEIVKFASPRQASDAGIGTVYQDLALNNLTSVTLNFFLGRELKNEFGILDKREMYLRSALLLDKVKLKIDPNTRVEKLKVGERQLLEIAKALMLDTKVLIMDEPTSAITDSEAKILFDIISGHRTTALTRACLL